MDISEDINNNNNNLFLIKIMGNDGGSIPGRAELVRNKPKEIRVESDLVAKVREFKKNIIWIV